jgi:hypothetical protein
MSWFEVRRLPCPACGVEVTIRVADSVNVARVPAVRAQLLAREFHRGRCGACQVDIEVDTSFVYSDIPRKQLVQVVASDALSRWRELEAQATAALAQAQAGPGAGEIMAGVRARLVFGLDGLVEKLLIWEAGLDDVAVEELKRLVRASLPDPAEQLLFVRATPAQLLFSNKPSPDGALVEVSRAALEAIAHGAPTAEGLWVDARRLAQPVRGFAPKGSTTSLK